MIKKRIFAGVSAIMLAAALTGCGGTKNETVSTDGSTSMEKVIGYLSEAYMDSHDGTKVTYNPTGSGAGIQAVMSGSCDIGLSSRDLKDDEAQTLDSTIVAIDGIAIIVNKDNPIADLSIDQIEKIYTGEVESWSDIGGSDSPIVCIGREAASGTRDGFESITGTEDKCKYAQELTSTGDVIQTVASNPNAIGYASIAAVGDTVKTVSVGGVEPTEENIQNGSYNIQRNFILVTKKDTKLTGAAKDFYDYCLSDEAADLIRKAGAVPNAK